ncbi:MAG: hypothetical protein J7M08_08410 [Planctomycetes bacterium]|nr:hypothetical protein [Planctomycetota bacterium]
MSALTKVFVLLVLLLSVAFAASQLILYQKREDYGTKYVETYEQLKGLRTEHNTLRAERDDLKRNLDSERAKNEALQKNLDEQKKTAGELAAKQEDKIQRLDADNKKLVQRCEERHQEIASLYATIKEMEANLASLEKTVNKKQADISGLQQVIAERESAIGDLQHQLRETKKDRQRLAEDNARYHGMVKNLVQRGIRLGPEPTPAINGIVVSVDPKLDFAVINKGAKDKVKANTQFEIYDDAADWVATLVINEVEDAVAGGMVISHAEGRSVKVGDKATTEIQIP